MGTTTIDYADESPCIKCGAAVAIEREQCGNCGTFLHRLTAPEFMAEVERKNIVDARHGGLVIGRSNRDDDIPLFQHQGNGVFAIVGLMHGGEFVVSRGGTHLHRARLDALNEDKGADGYGPTSSFTISPRSIVLNCDVLGPNGGLWVDDRGQFIINAYATWKHFDELEWLNFEAAPYPGSPS